MTTNNKLTPLEEAANKYCRKEYGFPKDDVVKDFKAGANWKEQNEEEVKSARPMLETVRELLGIFRNIQNPQGHLLVYAKAAYDYFNDKFRTKQHGEGLKWVKASERLPDKKIKVFFKWKRPIEVEYREYSCGYLQDILTYSNRHDVIWLDESFTPQQPDKEVLEALNNMMKIIDQRWEENTLWITEREKEQMEEAKQLLDKYQKS